MKVLANNNWLTSVTFRGQPYRLRELNLQDNRLKSIDFEPPATLKEINLSGNRVRPLQVPKPLARKINTMLSAIV